MLITLSARSRIDTDFARFEDAFQTVPGKRLHEYLRASRIKYPPLAYAEHRLDHREIGDQSPHIGLVFDATDQVVVVASFEDDRSAFAFAIVDQQIDFVAQKGLGLGAICPINDAMPPSCLGKKSSA